MRTTTPQKDPIVASRAVVCANHPLASSAGLAVLAAGGNVVDAAVAAIFTCAVVEPHMVGVLGGGYILHRTRSGDVSVIDNYCEGPGSARADIYGLAESGEVVDRANEVGHRAAAVPGCVKGWFSLHQARGRLPIRQVLAPAISAAEHGFPVSAYLATAFRKEGALLATFPESRRIFLPGGHQPGEGAVLRNPDLAETLTTLAEDGPETLYGGRIGQAIAADMDANGGLITMADLEQYEVRHLEPIRGSYRGYEISGTPPSSGGGLLNQLGLNILENFDIAALGFGTARYWHVVIETLKLMFADRNRYLGDDRFVSYPRDMLLSKDYAKGRACLINLKEAGQFEAGDPLVAGRKGGHTTHLTVTDAEGETVTMTQTIVDLFGARVVVPGTGMVWNDAMVLFDPRPGRPNSIGPRKRMLTATAATIVEKNSRLAFSVGTPGGTHIFPSVLQAIVNVIDHGMDLQAAVDAPRVWSNGASTLVEQICDPEVVAELAKMGHRIEKVPTLANCMNGIQMDERSGMLRGAACWRGDGTPAGFSGGFAMDGVEAT